MLDFLDKLKRTHTCGELRPANDGERVTLMGWVNRRRDLGNIIFVDLRDRNGLTQIVFDAADGAAIHEKAEKLRSEFVVAVTGKVEKRDASTVNANLPTGQVEVRAEELLILNDSKVPPFSPSDDATSTIANEEMRLKYRYIDLRRPAMQANIRLRHDVALAIRNHLASLGFYEIETPFMTRSTPEGARDYLVPSRVYPGSFYALPQSPQLFKQILMISGFDKYFQIVRCFRDEDLRADRQPEFTQIDLEMTFPQQETVWGVVEGFLKAAFKAAGHELETPFPRMTYDEAIQQYGIDKPDLRLPAMVDVRDSFTAEDYEALKIDSRLPVLAIRIPNGGKLSDKESKDLRALADARGQKDKNFIGTYYDWKQIEKKRPELAAKIRHACSAGENDLVVPVAAINKGGDAPTRNQTTAQYTAAGQLRLDVAQKFSDHHKAFEKTGNVEQDFRFVWVADFPMFEWDETEKRWNAAHHPFTSPLEDDLKSGRLISDPGAVRARAYDVVLNGTELGSGSIRIHQQEVQKQIFRALGMSDEEAKSRFGFFLEALEYGTPPHGGIALGLDRIVMILAGADSLREVIPFPKTAKAVDMMVDAPTPVSEQQLKELGIGTKT
jgi:aspartyl-tRNA synthetase